MGKCKEFRSALLPLGYEVERSDADCEEVQADTLEEVVRSCLEQLRRSGLDRVVIDDSGLFVRALSGFPGVYSAYALGTIGMGGVLRLLEGAADRSAHFECCVGATINGEDIVVTGRCEGSIALQPSGSGGFGFDPIFVPSGYDRTFAEISISEKNDISHRGRAIQALVAELRVRNEARR